MLVLSDILPRVYSAIGTICIPMVFALTAIYFAWDIIRGYIGLEDKQPDAWNLSGKFGAHMVKIALVVALLAFPLPRFITSVAIEPIFNIGLSLSHAVDKQFTIGTEDEFSFEECLVASAVMDPSSATQTAAVNGAFSPKLRHNMACQVGGIHQMTGLGMTAGWTMMNMAFNDQYMHKLIFGIPIFPNVVMFLAGLLITILFFFALLPVPLYFLQTFITLAMNLIMLPLMMLSWLFGDWKILQLGATPKVIFDDVVRDTLGIAMLGIFTSFAVMFLNAAFGDWGMASALNESLVQNDSSILIEGLMMNNGSIITIVMLGLFLAMFMNAIPALIQALFADVKIPQKLYDDTRDNLKKISGNVKEWWGKISR
jgi:hypothetical protein